MPEDFHIVLAGLLKRWEMRAFATVEDVLAVALCEWEKYDEALASHSTLGAIVQEAMDSEHDIGEATTVQFVQPEEKAPAAVGEPDYTEPDPRAQPTVAQRKWWLVAALLLAIPVVVVPGVLFLPAMLSGRDAMQSRALAVAS